MQQHPQTLALVLTIKLTRTPTFNHHSKTAVDPRRQRLVLGGLRPRHVSVGHGLENGEFLCGRTHLFCLFFRLATFSMMPASPPPYYHHQHTTTSTITTITTIPSPPYYHQADGSHTGMPRSTLRPHKDMVTDILFLKDRGLFATCSLDKKVILWGLDNMKQRGQLIGEGEGWG